MVITLFYYPERSEIVISTYKAKFKKKTKQNIMCGEKQTYWNHQSDLRV